MERVLDFSDVTSYDFSLMGADMVLKLFQGNVVTKIRIGTDKNSQNIKAIQDRAVVATNAPAMAAPVKQVAVAGTKPVVMGLIRKDEPKPVPSRQKRVPLTRLTEAQVKEIRQNWDATVKACGTKNAAADQLGRVYNCSAKNIYAIIYRYSWANI